MERVTFCCRLLLDPTMGELKQAFLTEPRKAFALYLKHQKKSEAVDAAKSETKVDRYLATHLHRS